MDKTGLMYTKLSQQKSAGEGSNIDFDLLLKTSGGDRAAERILESSYGDVDFMRMDTLDKFLDFVFFKVRTGYYHILSMAYPARRMMDKELEEKVIEMINVHLMPEIVLKLLKFFTRNINDSDTNLSMANLIHADDIVKAVYETYLLFRKDIFITDPEKKGLNVKRIQQFTARSEVRLSSPLDSAARLKYILEFLSIKLDVRHIYRREDLALAGRAEESR